MRVAIIGGSGIYKLNQGQFKPQIIKTPYGQAQVYLGLGDAEDLVFLTRHGLEHHIPPHRVNYRANIKAIKQLEVERVLAAFAVGSLHTGIPPHSLVALDQFIDFTQGREGTFFDGGPSGLAHIEVTNPYCAGLRRQVLALAAKHGLEIRPQGTYVCTNGPRFETAAEVRMFAQLGGDVVGMTGVPEAQLARELGLHYAGVAFSINWGAGLKGAIQIESENLDKLRSDMLSLFVATLRAPSLGQCECKTAMIHPPAEVDQAT